MYGIFIILAGVANLYYALKFIRDPQFAENYIKKSPKAFIWKKLFGEEKAIKITRNIFAPIGLLLGIGFPWNCDSRRKGSATIYSDR